MKEIRYTGFLNMDLLSTLFLGEVAGFLYVFNLGNFPKVRHFLASVNKEEDSVEVSDWLSNRLMDEGVDAFADVTEIYRMEMSDLRGNDGYEELNATIAEYQKKGSIGNEFLCIEFKVGK